MKIPRIRAKYVYIGLLVFVLIELSAIAAGAYALARFIEVAEETNPVVKQVLDSIDKWSIPDVAFALRLWIALNYGALAALITTTGLAIGYIIQFTWDIILLYRKRRESRFL